MMRVLVEALIVGIIVVIVGTLQSKIFDNKSAVKPACKDWNKNYVMEKGLFVTGVLTHIICELIGLNTWYCKNGSACRSLGKSMLWYSKV